MRKYLLYAIFIAAAMTAPSSRGDSASVQHSQLKQSIQQTIEEPLNIKYTTIGKSQGKSDIKHAETDGSADISKSLEEAAGKNDKSLETQIKNTIKIATFNIQVFGKSKRENEEVVDVLAKIVRNFDIVAVQEFRDKSETTLPYFVDKINELPGDVYNFIGSARLGRTASKEEYAFIFNMRTVSYANASYVYNDVNDVFEREPFIAGFKSGNFDYILINLHTKPDDAESEIQSLPAVIEDANMRFPNEKDVIALGDLNADGNYFSESIKTGFRSRAYVWAVPDSFDTTVAPNKYTYDRIVFLDAYTSEDFSGQVGVFRFDILHNLTPDAAKTVSDHYPVWAVFYTNKDTN